MNPATAAAAIDSVTPSTTTTAAPSAAATKSVFTDVSSDRPTTAPRTAARHGVSGASSIASASSDQRTNRLSLLNSTDRKSNGRNTAAPSQVHAPTSRTST